MFVDLQHSVRVEEFHLLFFVLMWIVAVLSSPRSNLIDAGHTAGVNQMHTARVRDSDGAPR